MSDDGTVSSVTGQPLNDSDGDVGLRTAIALVNELSVARPDAPGEAVRRVLSVDPPSVAALTDEEIPALCVLADRLRAIALAIDDDDLDTAAGLVNALLAEHSAHPHLAKESGRWQLHHHPPDAAVVAMWTAIAADAFARLIGEGRAGRVGACAANDCQRIFVDESKNASKRFCSTRCQNRMKAIAFRARQR
jgi:hypothetical protein